MSGFQSKMMNKVTWEMVKIASKIGQDHYPEILGVSFIVNAPTVFTGVWAVARNFLDEKTRKKIKIKGKDFMKELSQVIDADCIPDFLGGTCQDCQAHGGCGAKEIGAWMDYSYTYADGIKKIGE